MRADTATTVNLDEYKAILLSMDEKELEKAKWIFEGERKFLDGKLKANDNKVAFTTYPRTGNTFLNTYLESILHLELGFDMPI